MKTEKMILFCMALLCLFSAVYMRPLSMSSAHVNLLEFTQKKSVQTQRGNSITAGIGISNQMKYGHGVASRGVSGGQGGGSMGVANGGGSSPSDRNGGTSAIPVYAAGAANSRRNSHHSAGRSNWSNAVPVVVLASMLVTLVEVLWI